MTVIHYRDAAEAAEHLKREGRDIAAVMIIGLSDTLQFPHLFLPDHGDGFTHERIELLKTLVDTTARVARLGIEKLAIFWCDNMSLDRLVLASYGIRRSLGRTVNDSGKTISLDFRIGIAQRDESTDGLPEDGIERLINEALVAHGTAIRTQLPYKVFQEEDVGYYRRHWVLAQHVQQALSDDELYLVYQPRFNMQTRQCDGVEALLRWDYSDGEEISPSDFIPIIEQTGYIIELTDWIFKRGASELQQWLAADPSRSFSFNISALNLGDPEFAAILMQSISLWSLNPGQLILEITETEPWALNSNAIDTLCKLKQAGARIAIDDFGTGHSSYINLRQAPVDMIKLDRSFVSEMEKSETDRLIVESMIDSAHRLSLDVVAEGVESDRTAEMLMSMGCSAIQGYAVSKPMRGEAFLQWAGP